MNSGKVMASLIYPNFHPRQSSSLNRTACWTSLLAAFKWSLKTALFSQSFYRHFLWDRISVTFVTYTVPWSTFYLQHWKIDGFTLHYSSRRLTDINFICSLECKQMWQMNLISWCACACRVWLGCTRTDHKTPVCRVQSWNSKLAAFGLHLGSRCCSSSLCQDR